MICSWPSDTVARQELRQSQCQGGQCLQALAKQAVSASQPVANLVAVSEHALHTLGSFGPSSVRDMTNGEDVISPLVSFSIPRYSHP